MKKLTILVLLAVAASFTSCQPVDGTVDGESRVSLITIDKAEIIVEKSLTDSISYSYFYDGAYCYLVDNNTAKIEKRFYLDYKNDYLGIFISIGIVFFGIGLIVGFNT